MKPDTGGRAAQVLLALLKAMCYLALFVGMQVATTFLMAMALGAAVGFLQAMGGQVDSDELYWLFMDNTMLIFMISGLLTIAVVLAFYLLRRKKLSEALWLRPAPAPTLLAGAALAPGLYAAVSYVFGLLPEEWLSGYEEASSAALGGGGLVGAAAIVIVSPVVEELIFRGLIMTRLSRAMPGWLAVVLSAAAFGACHGHPVWFAYAFLAGVLFGLMDLRAGSILPSMLGHVVFNGISQLLSFLWEAHAGLLGPVWVSLLAVAVAAPILDRRGVAAIFRPASKAAPALEPLDSPGVYDFNPWEE